MNAYQIIGIMLVHNEDIFIERAIRNVVDFCDKIIITDHQSTDQTYAICQRLAGEFPKIDLRRIEHPSESADAIAPYYGTNTWVFGVDGDEIYDPEGLAVMRKRLMEGNFSDMWCVFGNVLNVTELDLGGKTAKGHLAPPSRPVTKLYNFSIIEDWLDCTEERLHGEKIVFKPGYHFMLRRYLHQELQWDESYFRCLHVPFLTRSSQDGASGLLSTRLNPDEIARMGIETNPLRRLAASLKVRLNQLLKRDWKNQKYRRGPLVEKDVSVFFP